MNIIKIYSDGFQDHWELPAMTDFATGRTVSYGGLVAGLHRLHLLLDRLQVARGTRVAVVGHNSIDWVIAFMGVITRGATVVTFPPVQPTADGGMLSYLADAGVEYLFVDPAVTGYDQADLLSVPSLKGVISLDLTTLLAARSDLAGPMEDAVGGLDAAFAKLYPYGFGREHAVAPLLPPDDVVAIFFTSGTVAPPKGVMLMADNLEGNIIHGLKINMFPCGTDSVVSTTMGSVWSSIFNVMVPLASGARLIITDGVRDPARLAEVFMRVRPVRVLLSSGMLRDFYEYVRSVSSSLRYVRLARHVPGGSWIEHMATRRTFRRLIGGRYCEIITGFTFLGSTLSYNLRRAGVRFTVAYGLTECGGLVSYAPSASYRIGTAGHVVSGLLRCRVRPLDYKGLPAGAGELEVKGMTVMKGYLNRSGAPSIPMTSDGWFMTGDICTISPHGDITIIGRKSTLIHLGRGVVSAERIQTILCERPEIAHAIVMGRDGRLTAIVHPDFKAIKRLHGDADPESVVGSVVADVNRLLSIIEHIDDVEVSHEPLHTTFKNTVARYYYC